MKYLNIGLVFCIICLLLPLTLGAQSTIKININSTVYGPDGEAISGAVIRNQEDSILAVTDAEGAFALQTTMDALLKIDAIGFETAYTSVTNNMPAIVLAISVADMVQVAFKKVNKHDLQGGVSYVNISEIMPKNYTSYSLDGVEALVSGYNGNLWGMGGVLILVDGVPRDATNVLSTEIEQISFLKGVSAVALYGSRAAKGVIYITTKRGKAEEQRIDVRVNGGALVPKSYPKYLGSAEYMSLYNEARRNDGLNELYSEEDIYHYASGENPFRYPDVDYFSSDYLKDFYTRYDVTTEISGGNDRARYYTNFGFIHTNALLNFGEAVDNGGSNRFNVRGNIDIDLNDFITCYVDATAIFYTGKGVNANYWGSSSSLRPNSFSPLVPIGMIDETDEASQILVSNSSHIIDGQYLLGGNQLFQTNPFAEIYAGGNNKYNSRQFQFNTGVNADLGNLLDGLSFSSMLAVDYSSTYSLAYNNDFAVYEAVWNNFNGADQISYLNKYGNDSKSGTQDVSNSWYSQTMAFSGQFNYVKTVNKDHHISAILLANGYQQSYSEEYHRVNNANLGLQLAYNFREKYYADFSSAVIHSAKLPEGNRNALSPTVTLGWRILKDQGAVDNLKVNASAGIIHTDLDISDYYLYQGYYTYTDAAWYSWRDGGLVHTFDRRRGNNDELKFPKREEINLGVEGSFWKGLLTLNASVFSAKINGNIVQPSVLYPSYFSTGWPVYSDIPYVNYNEDLRQGFDCYVSLNKRIGKIDWSLGVSGNYFNSKATTRAENYEYDYQNRAGKPLDALWGLENDGFFMDQDDIDNSPYQTFGEVQPGDIKYVDQNGDGEIDAQDEVYLGKAGWYGAPFSMGVNLTVKWKNLTFFALGTGRMGANAMKNNSYWWVDGEDKYSEVVRDRWTEETATTALYPRLTTNNSDNNFRSSDFWLYSTNRFDLAKIQVSYDLPKSIFNNSFIQELGFYVSGSNLLTIAPERKILELNVGQAPQTRFYNFGVKALF